MIKLKNLLLENKIDFQSMINDVNIQDSIKKFGIEKTEDYFNQIVNRILERLFVYRLISLPRDVDPLKIQKEIVLKENSRIRLLSLDCYDINTSKKIKSLTVNSFRQV